jgi:hypothetical protein
MDEEAVREHAQATCVALLAGDIGKAAEEVSKELRANVGSIVGMLPLPLTEATVESIEMTPHGYWAILHLAGETDMIRLETRWKDRYGRPIIVEASRVHEEPVAPTAEPEPRESEEH